MTRDIEAIAEAIAKRRIIVFRCEPCKQVRKLTPDEALSHGHPRCCGQIMVSYGMSRRAVSADPALPPPALALPASGDGTPPR